MAPDAEPTQPSKKGKEREAPQPTDFAARMVALQRKQAQCVPTKLLITVDCAAYPVMSQDEQAKREA